MKTPLAILAVAGLVACSQGSTESELKDVKIQTGELAPAFVIKATLPFGDTPIAKLQGINTDCNKDELLPLDFDPAQPPAWVKEECPIYGIDKEDSLVWK